MKVNQGKNGLKCYRINRNSFEDFQVLGAELNEDGEWLNVAYVAAQMEEINRCMEI